jgi:hypothetical protein
MQQNEETPVIPDCTLIEDPRYPLRYAGSCIYSACYYISIRYGHRNRLSFDKLPYVNNQPLYAN